MNMLRALEGEVPMASHILSNCCFVASSIQVETWTDIKTPLFVIVLCQIITFCTRHQSTVRRSSGGEAEKRRQRFVGVERFGAVTGDVWVVSEGMGEGIAAYFYDRVFVISFSEGCFVYLLSSQLFNNFISSTFRVNRGKCF